MLWKTRVKSDEFDGHRHFYGIDLHLRESHVTRRQKNHSPSAFIELFFESFTKRMSLSATTTELLSCATYLETLEIPFPLLVSVLQWTTPLCLRNALSLENLPDSETFSRSLWTAWKTGVTSYAEIIIYFVLIRMIDVDHRECFINLWFAFGGLRDQNLSAVRKAHYYRIYETSVMVRYFIEYLWSTADIHQFWCAPGVKSTGQRWEISSERSLVNSVLVVRLTLVVSGVHLTCRIDFEFRLDSVLLLLPLRDLEIVADTSFEIGIAKQCWLDQIV